MSHQGVATPLGCIHWEVNFEFRYLHENTKRNMFDGSKNRTIINIMKKMVVQNLMTASHWQCISSSSATFPCLSDFFICTCLIFPMGIFAGTTTGVGTCLICPIGAVAGTAIPVLWFNRWQHQELLTCLIISSLQHSCNPRNCNLPFLPPDAYPRLGCGHVLQHLD